MQKQIITARGINTLARGFLLLCLQLSCPVALAVPKEYDKCIKEYDRCEKKKCPPNGSCRDLEKKLKNCCADQAACCTEILEGLAQIEAQLAACCKSTSCPGSCNITEITTIPAGGLVIDKPGHYIVCNELTFSTSASLNARVDQIAASQQARYGITITSSNVSLDLNSHSYTITGAFSGGIAIINNVSHASVTGGTIVGSNAHGQIGIAITAVAASVSNVAFANVGAAVPAAVSAVSVVGVAAAAAAVAAAIVVAPEVTLPPPPLTTRSGLKQTPTPVQGGILIRDISVDGGANGLIIQTSVANLILQNASILNSAEMGISQPLRSGYHGNFLLENVQISNSGLNGIYTTFNQDNWILKNVQIRNSVFNGAIFEGFQNLSIQDSQIYESGAKGLVASIRQSQNVSLSGLEIFNSGDEALRVDNVQNLSIDRSLFTNYSPTSLPLAKIQDVNNGFIKNSQFMSLGGLADGLFIRNSHGLIVENNLVKVFNNFSDNTPTPQPPIIGEPPVINTGNPVSDTIVKIGCRNGSGPVPPEPACLVGRSSPVGINLQGGVTATQVRNTVVSGTPSIGIAVQPDSLNGTDEGVILENILVDGAQCTGILFAGALNCAVFNSQILNGQGDGISIDSESSQTAARGNTLTNNRSFGIRNSGINSQIYQNFASANGKNYSSNIMI